MKYFIFILGLFPTLLQAAQTCLPDVAPTTPTSEFTIHSNGTVTHSRTELVWDRCPWGQSGANCEQGSAGEYTWEQAQQQAVIANQKSYKGYTDWRVPTKRELISIVEYQCYRPAINETVFPGTPPIGWFWSGSPLPHNLFSVGFVDFHVGSTGYLPRIHTFNVRLVRGGQSFGPLPDEAPQSCNNGTTPLPAEFDIHADGTATHSRTGLMWDRCTYGQQGTDCGIGSATMIDTLTEAFQAVKTANVQGYKGYHDWRLPTVYELHAITEEACWNPALNTTAFPSAPSSAGRFLSGSLPAGYPDSDIGLIVDFCNAYCNDHKDIYVRLVRDGQTSVSLPLTITPSTGGIVTSTGIYCGTDCSGNYTTGSNVTLTATPNNGWQFSQWSGDCSGTNPSVSFTMDMAKTCTATFVQTAQPDIRINTTTLNF